MIVDKFDLIDDCAYEEDITHGLLIVADILRNMDKKMHQVTKRIQTAEGEIRAGKKKQALADLKKAEAKNEKLVKIDRDVRDPAMKRLKKIEKVVKKGKK